jgi:hypothetical protein
MANSADDFQPSSLVVQQKKYIIMSGLKLEPQQNGNDIDTYFRPLVQDLMVMWYNDGVQVWDEHKR